MPSDILVNLYSLIAQLQRYNHLTARSVLPHNGIYLFFEKGEDLDLDGEKHPRIVRVGTHIKDGNFPQRIRQHYGNVNSLNGNKNGSVFRLHLGGALMIQNNPNDPRLNAWLKHMGASDPQVEEVVSRQLRDNFTFAWIEVPYRNDRLALEEGLIALLALDSRNAPSKKWLGQYSARNTICRTGLWNTDKTSGQPLTHQQLEQLQHLVSGCDV